MTIKSTRKKLCLSLLDRTLHFFSFQLALDYGINESILLTDLARNIKNIKSHSRHPGWFFSTLEEFCDRHPYLTKDQIRYALEILRDKKVLITTGKYNRKSYDRTLWYAFSTSEIFKEALSKSEYAISFVVADAMRIGVKPAILLRRARYNYMVNRLTDDDFNPTDLHDEWGSLMSPAFVRKAWAVIVNDSLSGITRKYSGFGKPYEYSIDETPYDYKYHDCTELYDDLEAYE